MPSRLRVSLLTLFPLFLLAFLAQRTDAQELSDLYLRKMKAAFATPSKQGHARSRIRVVGRLASHQLPPDFTFHPARTPLSLSVGGVSLLAASGTGTWKQTGSFSWKYREKGERRVKLTIEFGRGEFTFRASRLDLAGMSGPLDCDVFVFLGDQVFGTRVDGQEAGHQWKWVPRGGGIPSKAPGYVPLPPEEPEDPGTGGGGGGGSGKTPLSFRVLVHGTTTNQQPAWQDHRVVRDHATFMAEWSKMFGATPPPSVDFSQEQVILFHERGNLYQIFNVYRTSSGTLIEYRPAALPGLRTWVYRAIAVPIVPGTVTFQPI